MHSPQSTTPLTHPVIMPRVSVALAAVALATPTLGFSPAGLAPQLASHRRGAARQTCAAPRMGLFDGFLKGDGKGDGKGVVFKEWTSKETVDGPKGAGLKGDIDVLFKIGEQEIPTRAFAGQPLSEVASQVVTLLTLFMASDGAPSSSGCRLVPASFIFPESKSGFNVVVDLLMHRRPTPLFRTNARKANVARATCSLTASGCMPARQISLACHRERHSKSTSER